jgi:hypothetical protein
MKARKESHMPSDREWNEAQERANLVLTPLMLIATNIAWIECFFSLTRYSRTSICSYYANTWTEGSALFTVLCGIIIAGVVGIVTLEKR